mmetsp:Transcript_94318/g.215781  ORF Transcript_94318/g.215781 Transcript_94318/m.215781 type:complete len:224 (-) Transcript_94318:67-738(-)
MARLISSMPSSPRGLPCAVSFSNAASSLLLPSRTARIAPASSNPISTIRATTVPSTGCPLAQVPYFSRFSFLSFSAWAAAARPATVLRIVSTNSTACFTTSATGHRSHTAAPPRSDATYARARSASSAVTPSPSEHCCPTTTAFKLSPTCRSPIKSTAFCKLPSSEPVATAAMSPFRSNNRAPAARAANLFPGSPMVLPNARSSPASAAASCDDRNGNSLFKS